MNLQPLSMGAQLLMAAWVPVYENQINVAHPVFGYFLVLLSRYNEYLSSTCAAFICIFSKLSFQILFEH